MSQEDAPTLVFDLDGTLIESISKQNGGIHRPAASFPPSDFHIFENTSREREVRVRHGCRELLKGVSAVGFRIAIWTAAPRDYAEAIVDGLDRHVFSGLKTNLVALLTEEDTHSGGIKDLAGNCNQLESPLWRVLIVDDNPRTYSNNESNALPVPRFCGAWDDTLLALRDFLTEMHEATGGVVLDVTGWRYVNKYAKLQPLRNPKDPGHRSEEGAESAVGDGELTGPSQGAPWGDPAAQGLGTMGGSELC